MQDRTSYRYGTDRETSWNRLPYAIRASIRRPSPGAPGLRTSPRRRGLCLFSFALASVALLSSLLTACNGYKAASTKNFTGALNTYFVNHPECLYSSALRFPYELNLTQRDPNRRGLDALASAGLLTRDEEKGIQVNRYSLTPYASNHLDPRFCYGHRVVTSIDSSTPPSGPHGQQTSQVTYHYKVAELAAWTHSKQMLAAFPLMAKEITGEPQATTQLVLTLNGWRVPE